MDAIVGFFIIFVTICVICTFVVVGLALLIGILILAGKLIVWMAYLGVIFILLGFASWLAVTVWSALRDHFS